MEQRVQEVVHDRVVGNPTQTTELIVKVLILLEQGRPLGVSETAVTPTLARSPMMDSMISL